MQALNLCPIHVYGLTETYGPYTICEWHEEWNHLPQDEQARLLAWQRQGYVTADRVREVDEAMNDIPRDEETMGEVVMYGNNVMWGYFENPEATATAFKGGWFHSGDIAAWHPDGYIELRDRKKDIIFADETQASGDAMDVYINRHSHLVTFG